MVTLKDKRQEIIQEYRASEHDTGSPDVQVALLTDRIQYLSEHLKQHVKDFHSRHGLMRLVARRARLLRYLARREPERYSALIKNLGLRR